MKIWDQYIKAPLGDRRLVRVSSLYRRLQALFGNFEITVKGGTISRKGDNGIHLEINGGGAGAEDYPFKVTADGDNLTISPGLVYNHTLAIGWTKPQINGVDLDAASPPVLAVGSGNVLICLVAEFGTDGAAINLPWQIHAYTSAPSDTTVRRANGLSTSPRPGLYHLLIASRSNGVIYNWVRGNMVANLQWEQLFVIG